MTSDESGPLDSSLPIGSLPSAIRDRPSASPLVRLLVVSMIARLVHDAAQRVVYPFLPEIAAGLRVPIDEMGRTLSLRSGMSLLSPLFGRLSDRVGHRRAMSVALALLAIGLGCVGAADGLAGATAGFVLFGIATAVYTPALMAYVSERTPYARRGRVIGAIEMTWAISGMVSVPLLGTLIGPLGWRAPFVTLAVAAAVCAALTLLLEETRPAVRATGEPFRIASIVRNRSALSFLLATFLIFFGFENIQVGYASWFESRFGLSAEARGWMQTAFGVFEIMASAGTSLFLDRIGKKRGMSGGLIVVLSAYVLLITVGPQALWLALASLCVAFLGFEFSVVAGIPIASEQIPQARGTMLAMLTMVTGLGRMIGAASGSAWIAGAGFIAAASMSAALAVVTVVVFVRGVKEQPSTDLKRTALAKSAQGQGG